MIDYKNILFCTDFSEDAAIAFNHALDMAKRYDAQLFILHVPHSLHTYTRHVVNEHVPEDAPSKEAFFDEDLAARAEKRLRETYEGKLSGFKNYEYVIKVGAPDIEIVRFAKKNEIDVIVMGALGKSEIHRLEHGSTVANVSKYAHCHVIAIRNPARRFTLPGDLY